MKDSSKQIIKTGFYGQAVQRIMLWLEPYLHRRTDRFIKDAIETHAKDDQRFASIIKFEVKRRGHGAGMTQDVAEPLFWTAVKTVSALGVAAVTESLKDKQIKMAGRFTILGILLNNMVDLFRLIPRFDAGLQGSLEMAKERQRAILETGEDPFERGYKEVPVAILETETIMKNKKWTDHHPERASSSGLTGSTTTTSDDVATSVYR
jgi:hypothetical protein